MIAVLASLVLYAVTSITEMRALTLLGYENPNFAFIPFLRWAVLTEATQQEEGLFDIPMRTFRYWPVLIIVPAIGWLIALLPKMWMYQYVFALLDGQDPHDELTLACLASIITPVAWYKFLTAGTSKSA